MQKYSKIFLHEMPKSDLHLHLDGSLRIPSLIEMAKAMNVTLPSYTEEGLRSKVFKDSYKNLGEYLSGFQYTCAVLRNVENIERAAYELAIDNQNENVFYIEARFAPQLLMDQENNLTFEQVIKAAYKGFEKAKKEHNLKSNVVSGERPPFNYGIITCAMRNFEANGYSPYYSRFYKIMQYSSHTEILKAAALQMVKGAVKLRDEQNIPIVGIDLAGQEEGYPASHFKDVYAYAHKNFMHKTVHAGEAYGAESIFQAITECFTERIGHGYYLFDENKLADNNIKNKQKYLSDLITFVADNRTTIEVCLTSNLQTNPTIGNIKNHHIAQMLLNRMSLCICTDNRLVSNTSVTNEYELLSQNFDVQPKHLKDIVAYGFKKSFYPGTYIEKRNWAKKLMQYFDKIANANNIYL